jgi:PBP1b-binding outer membrane lipoprotein LpoB
MKVKIIYISLFLAALFLTQCANVVAPTGGPKDVTPPKVAEAKPENHNTGFDSNKIELAFDEYVTLNNANQEVLISPPLATKPDVKLNNKTVIIKFKEDLKPNTTYTVSLGNAVKDLHEGNVFSDYIYTFSTSDYIDTLSIAGKVINADDEKPAEGMFVALYEDSDSLFYQPTRRAPDFIARTDKEGAFRLNGLPNKRFLVFALNDVNANLYYDMPNEKVAFLDTLVPASFKQKNTQTIDTLLELDSISPVLDALSKPLSNQKSMDIKLFAFTEEDTSQMLLEKKLVEEGLLRFVFRHPADKVHIEFSEPSVDSFQMVRVWSKEKDTLSCFFTPNVIDSLKVVIQYDTLINDSTTYNLNYRAVQQQKSSNIKTMKVATNLRNKLLLPDEDFVLIFPEPVIDLRFHDISTLIAGADTLLNDFHFEQVDDYGMKYRLVFTVVDSVDYALCLTDSVFFSVRGRTNDSLNFRFRRALETDYGNIFLQVAPPEGNQVVVQLLNNKSNVVAQQVIDSVQRVGFTRLAPDKYKLRAVIDTNRNGKWSTGNYHQRFLPEAIVPHKDELDVKAGWDIDLDEVWNL